VLAVVRNVWKRGEVAGDGVPGTGNDTDVVRCRTAGSSRVSAAAPPGAPAGDGDGSIVQLY
jgi:hypothetical protein